MLQGRFDIPITKEGTYTSSKNRQACSWSPTKRKKALTFKGLQSCFLVFIFLGIREKNLENKAKKGKTTNQLGDSWVGPKNEVAVRDLAQVWYRNDGGVLLVLGVEERERNHACFF